MKKLVSWFKTTAALVLAWRPGGYEGARRYSTERSFIHGYPTDPRFDADQVTRLELLHKSRYFERNSAILNRLADLFEQFTVGSCGLQILPDSTDETWNDSAKTWWDSWCSSCDLASSLNFGMIQSLVARAWFIDGEIFIRKVTGRVKTAGLQSGKPVFVPKIQLLEAHRIETPGHLASMEGSGIIDGIEVNGDGRPTAYWYRDGFGLEHQSTYVRIPAEEIIHVFEPSRAGQMRGLPFIYPVINDLHDLDDLQILEQRAARDAAEKSTFLTTASGELNAEEYRRQKLNIATRTDTAGTDTLEQRVQQMRKTIGGRMFALASGEDVKQFVPQRPSVATVEYWNYLCSKVCAGVGITMLLVFPRSMQGTVARAELDVANAFFRARSAVLADAFKRVYQWAVGWGVQFDGQLDGAPKDGSWAQCSCRPPRGCNVDIGRNSSAMLAELAAGARTLESVYAETGQDWKREIRQSLKETAFFLRCCQEEGIDPVMARPALSQALIAQAQAEAAEQAAEDATDGTEELTDTTSTNDA